MRERLQARLVGVAKDDEAVLSLIQIVNALRMLQVDVIGAEQGLILLADLQREFGQIQIAGKAERGPDQLVMPVFVESVLEIR